MLLDFETSALLVLVLVMIVLSVITLMNTNLR